MNCFVVFGNECRDQYLVQAGGINGYQLKLGASEKFASKKKLFT